jgi:hypothetical protein
MSAMDNLFSDASVVAPIIAELCIVVAEAWLLTWISGCAYFHKVETKTLKYVPPSEYFRQPEVRRLSWGGALAISFLANGTSLLIGFL